MCNSNWLLIQFALLLEKACANRTCFVIRVALKKKCNSHPVFDTSYTFLKKYSTLNQFLIRHALLSTNVQLQMVLDSSCTFLKKMCNSNMFSIRVTPFSSNMQLQLVLRTTCIFLMKCVTPIGFRYKLSIFFKEKAQL